MLFNRKASFFLDLSGDEADGGSKAPAAPAVVAPVRAEGPKAAAPATAPSPAAPSPASAAPAAAAAGAAPNAAAAGGLTTAEAIAAELAAAAASRPPVLQATFAPECLTPGSTPLPRRRGGVALAGFRDMAKSMMGR